MLGEIDRGYRRSVHCVDLVYYLFWLPRGHLYDISLHIKTYAILCTGLLLHMRSSFIIGVT